MAKSSEKPTELGYFHPLTSFSVFSDGSPASVKLLSVASFVFRSFEEISSFSGKVEGLIARGFESDSNEMGMPSA